MSALQNSSSRKLLLSYATSRWRPFLPAMTQSTAREQVSKNFPAKMYQSSARRKRSGPTNCQQLSRGICPGPHFGLAVPVYIRNPIFGIQEHARTRQKRYDRNRGGFVSLIDRK